MIPAITTIPALRHLARLRVHQARKAKRDHQPMLYTYHITCIEEFRATISRIRKAITTTTP